MAWAVQDVHGNRLHCVAEGGSFRAPLFAAGRCLPDRRLLVYSSSYTWRVVGVGPFASVNAASPGISSLLNSFGSEGGPEGGDFDGYVTQSLSRTFTTAH